MKKWKVIWIFHVNKRWWGFILAEEASAYHNNRRKMWLNSYFSTYLIKIEIFPTMSIHWYYDLKSSERIKNINSCKIFNILLQFRFQLEFMISWSMWLCLVECRNAKEIPISAEKTVIMYENEGTSKNRWFWITINYFGWIDR